MIALRQFNNEGTAYAVAFDEGSPMVNHCANPQCCKPLHYLREGRVYVFDVTRHQVAGAERVARRMEHFWLCGTCSEAFFLEQTEETGVKISAKLQRINTRAIMSYEPPQSIAS